jgi:5-methylcytosine-specific restriction endonuclease McrA
MSITSHPCLLLSHDYVPLKIINVKQTFRLVMMEKADILMEYSDKIIRTVSKVFKVPAVIRLLHKISLKFPVKLSRKNIFIRDRYCCQYCGQHGTASSLTLDHCVPRSKGGKFSWDNLVASCVACNHKKGNKTPREAGMTLLRGTPRKMEVFEYISALINTKYKIPEWGDFLSRV